MRISLLIIVDLILILEACVDTKAWLMVLKVCEDIPLFACLSSRYAKISPFLLVFQVQCFYLACFVAS